MPAKTTYSAEWSPWAYGIVAAALVVLLIEVVRGSVHDVAAVRGQTLKEQLRMLQSRAMQRTAGLDVLLQAHEAAGQPWAQIRDEPWFSKYWSGIKLSQQAPYAAIVDSSGQIAVHTDPARVGRRLESGWYERKVSDGGPEVYWTQRSALGGERKVFDVTSPIQMPDGNSLGEYHEALDADWLESQVASKQKDAAAHWLSVILLLGAIDLAAGGALVYLIGVQKRIGRVLRGQTRQRSRELTQIGSGLAHEVRNPLHALRINLHTVRRSFTSRSPLPPDQLIDTIEESEAAIDRLDELMRDFVQFTDRAAGKAAAVNLAHEVKATLSLLADNMQQQRIDVNIAFSDQTATITIDPMRLRQLLLNVLTMAQHRAGKTGKIDVEVVRVEDGVELAVGDTGPALPDEQRARIFEPFQAPAETGSGLGLALVQVYVEEAGGRATWDKTGAAGRCRLWFPLAPQSKGSPL